MDSLTKLAEQVIEKLKHRHETLATAESCTGGLLAQIVTTISGASAVFQGGVVSYANTAKEDLLGVSHQSLDKHGAVSEQVALEMAKGAQKALRATWAISTTGVAGPLGGSKEKPIGTVCFGLCGPVINKTIFQQFPDLGRDENRKKASQFALEWLLQEIN